MSHFIQILEKLKYILAGFRFNLVNLLRLVLNFFLIVVLCIIGIDSSLIIVTLGRDQSLFINQKLRRISTPSELSQCTYNSIKKLLHQSLISLLNMLKYVLKSVKSFINDFGSVGQ